MVGLTYRPISVETGNIPQANGSARVKMGETDVIASMKAELGKPTPFQLTKARFLYMWTAVPQWHQCLRAGEVMSCQQNSRQLFSDVFWVEKVEQELEVISYQLSLSIVEGKVCWDLCIDGLVVSSYGNLLDALGAAIKAAFSNTRIPKVHVAASASSDGQPEVDISDEEFLQFDTSGVPVIVTLTKARVNMRAD